MRKYLLVLLLIPSIFINLYSQEQEVSETLWQDAGGDYQLFVTGSWTLDMLMGLGYTQSSTKGSYLQNLPSFEEGFLFTQTPDFTASLRIYDQLLAEVSYLGGFDNNTYLLGYEGREDQLVKQFYLGNTSINMDEYADQITNSQTYDSPGIKLKTETDKAKWETIFRYSPETVQTARFKGNQKTSSTSINLKDYSKGQYFHLPDDNVQDLEIYIQNRKGEYIDEDPASDDHYTKLEPEEYQYRQASNLLVLNAKSSGKVLIFYTKSGYTVGDSNIGLNSLPDGNSGFIDLDLPYINFNFSITSYLGTDQSGRLVNLVWKGISQGKDYYVLYDPSKFNPFESRNVYSDFDDSITSFELYALSNTADPIESYDYEPILSTNALRIQSSDSNDYPLGKDVPELYSPENNFLPTFFLAALSETQQSYQYYLGSGVLEDSLSIYINGHRTESYSFNPDTGYITFSQIIYPNDTIDVTYTSETSDGKEGSIYASSGLSYDINDRVNLQGNLQGSYNVTNSEYSSFESEHSAYINSALQLSYDDGNTFFKVTPQYNTIYTDTSGLYEFETFDQDSIRLSYYWGYEIPSAPPVSTVYGNSLTSTNEGILKYKDYSQYDEYGNLILSSYGSSSYNEESDKSGPYVTYGDDNIPYNINILDFSLTPSQSWVGSQHLLPSLYEGNNISEITLSIKNIDNSNLSTNSHIYLQIGTLSEDVNDNGAYDDDLYTQTGLNYGEYYDKGEDFDDNNVFQNSETLVTYELGTWDSSLMDWQNFTLELNNGDRKLLNNATAYRIIFYDSSATAITGKIAVSPIEIRLLNGVIDSTESESSLSRESPLNSQISLQNTALTILSIDNKTNNILWHWKKSNPTTVKAYSKYYFTSPMPIKDYEEWSLYIHTLDGITSPETITLTLFDSEGRTQDWTVEADELILNQWEQLRFPTKDWPYDTEAYGLILSSTAADTIELLVDELLLYGGKQDSIYMVDTYVSTNLNTLLSLPKHPYIPNTNVEWTGKAYNGEYYNSVYSLDTKWDILWNDLSIDHSYYDDSSNDVDIKNEGTLALWDKNIRLTDTYDSRGSHSNKYSLTIPGQGSLSYRQGINYDNSTSKSYKSQLQYSKPQFNFALNNALSLGQIDTIDKDKEFYPWQSTIYDLYDYSTSYKRSYHTDSLQTQFRWSVLAPQLGISQSLNTLRKSPYTQQSTQAIKMSLPIYGRGFSLTPYYSKSLKKSVTYASNREISFQKEAGFDQWRSDWPQFLSQWYRELFYQPYVEREKEQEILYTPEGGVSIKRDIGFSPWELIAPNFITASAQTKTSAYEDSINYDYQYSLGLESSSINLLGTQSHWLKIPFFLTDIQNHRYRISWNKEDVTFSGMNRVTLQITKSKKYLSNIEYEFVDGQWKSMDLEWQFQTKTAYMGHSVLPYVPKSLIQSQSVQNTERLNSYWLRDKSYEIWLGHETKVILAKQRGSIKVYLDLGYYTQEDILTYGFRTGIQSIIQY
ncbi:hypothetical protein [Spirochaeta cellobiosiphila]|uniref:hypothetical protein n=1 Tax=Spirochaeta cellobiosiphila TaxID=504483 RepID=UPI00040245AE|nr:hypothetical protein [Spirochaeta cellobiosiphila]